MTAQVARLALPFTDSDLATGDVRVYNTATATAFTVTLPLPSVSGISDGYYNGGDLDGGDTTTFTLPDESLVMALAMAISVHVSGFDLDVTEDVLPGRYKLERQDVNQWELRWDDVATTMPAEWLGFDDATYVSSSQIITAPWQSDRLWRATRPTWNRQREHKKTSHAMTWSGGVSTRQLSNIRNEWELKYSAQVGPRVYKHDGTIQTLVDLVPEMALNDPNVALESLWEWIAARTPVEYWADEDDLTTSEYLRPLRAEALEAVIRVIGAERSSAPPVYDLVLPFVSSSAGAAGVGGGGIICPPTAALETFATYEDLPTDKNGKAGTHTDGTKAEVTTTDAAAVYTYVASVDGYTLDMWLPSDIVSRGIVYGKDASSNPIRISTANGIGGEDVATLLARGWIASHLGSGAVADSGGDILFSTGGSSRALWQIAPVATNPTTWFLVMEMDCIAVSGSNDMRESSITLIANPSRPWWTWAHAGIAGDFSYFQNTSIAAGDGNWTLSGAYERIFSKVEAQTTLLGGSWAWEANLGQMPTKMATLQMTQTQSTAVYSFGVWVQQVNAVAGSTSVREVHLFEVG